MAHSEQQVRPTLEYAGSAPPLSNKEVGWAVLPALLVLAIGVALPLAIAYWLRVQYGPHAITQWTKNAAQVEFWSCDVPFLGWLVLWAITLAVSLRRCMKTAGRLISIAVSVLALLVVGFTFLTIMDGPFP